MGGVTTSEIAASPPVRDPAVPLVSARDRYRPSEYTGLLMHTVRSRAAGFGRGQGLDMGVGSGVLLAMLGGLGMQRLWGVDVDPGAVHATQDLLDELGLLSRANVLCGSLWEPVGDERFDVVVANLPHFAATEPSDPEHVPSWSMGGADGRMIVDPFLAGLGSHLRDGGVAFMTHNMFIGFDRTQAILRQQGLNAVPVVATAALLHPMKSMLLHQNAQLPPGSPGLSRFGPYEFAEVAILEIRATGAA